MVCYCFHGKKGTEQIIMSVIKTTIPESRRRWQIDYGKALNVGEGIFSLRRVLAKTEKKHV